MGVFDQSARYIVKHDPPAFFAWRVPRFWARYVFSAWLDTTTLVFPGEPERVCDTVGEFVPRSGEGPRRLLHVESQTEPDYDMLERMGEYGYWLRREKRAGVGREGKYLVAGLLLNLTGAEQPSELDMREETLDGRGLYVGVTQVTLSTEDAASTLARVAAGELARSVLPWAALMRGAEQEGIINQWRRLAEGEPDERWKADMGGLALVFADLTGRWAAWKKGLEGFAVRQSLQVKEWQDEARCEQLREDVQLILRVRFRMAVPEDLAARIAMQQDIAQLSRWVEIAATAENLEAFRQATEQPAAPGNGNGASA